MSNVNEYEYEDYQDLYRDLYEDNHEECKYCGWMSEFMESHIEYSMQGYGIGIEKRCKYIDSIYKISINKEGELIITKKKCKKLKICKK